MRENLIFTRESQPVLNLCMDGFKTSEDHERLGNGRKDEGKATPRYNPSTKELDQCRLTADTFAHKLNNLLNLTAHGAF